MGFRSTLRRLGIFCVMLVAVSGIGAGFATAASANDVTNFQVNGPSDETAGTITWFNRSIRIQGYVTDSTSGWTTVKFNSYTDDWMLQSTRTANDGTTSFGFNVDASDVLGGVFKVNIQLCNTGTCYGSATYWRP